MLAKDNDILAALTRARRFLEENAAHLASFIDIAAARKRLDDLIASFNAQAADQRTTDRSVKGESAKQQQLREELTADIIRPIAEIARRKLHDTPEFAALKMPRHVTGPAFVADATSMLRAATLHKDVLLERGMSSDFLEQFESSLTQLAQSASDRDQHRVQRVGATRGLTVQGQEGRSVLKVLDALLNRALRGDATLLASWESARAIHRRPSSTPATTATQAAPTPASTPISTATLPATQPQ